MTDQNVLAKYEVIYRKALTSPHVPFLQALIIRMDYPPFPAEWVQNLVQRVFDLTEGWHKKHNLHPGARMRIIVNHSTSQSE